MPPLVVSCSVATLISNPIAIDRAWRGGGRVLDGSVMSGKTSVRLAMPEVRAGAGDAVLGNVKGL